MLLLRTQNLCGIISALRLPKLSVIMVSFQVLISPRNRLIALEHFWSRIGNKPIVTVTFHHFE